MRSVPAALSAHLEASATTVARAWRLVRSDGVVLGFTDHDAPLTFGGTRYEAASGLSAGETEAMLGLGAGTQEIDGALSSAAIKEADILAGRYDGARVETYVVNWQTPDEHCLLDVHEIGEVKRGGPAFTAELRGIASRLDRRRGRLYRRRCDAVLGDARCGIDLSAPHLVRDVVYARMSSGALVVTEAEDVDPVLFSGGHLVWTSGVAKSLSAEIAGLYPAGGGGLRVETIGAARLEPSAGDRLRLHAGCDRSFSTCRSRFGNGLNFRGFPHLPGSDAALGVAKSSGLHDGMPVVP
ncbi:hypothetical protein ASG43_01040 [Aureimonas sp. Leaf454]|uniref:DUF2163 domain-containing protein n=1 Tax=Aureimonas sp. Leaf454 TaxID=1736381 RepID=UPI0006FBC02E|nr:DUF2163 domain-containing protein [Aureimonas sp. Leaf454]KQT54244.1 hypothetical protein ASG43_01040 [Aureimonas sp. Leaf454]